jgi:glycosyltransferase involved in cell wall biosynthesis
LPEAIDSCLSQDVDFRLFILDNASTDNTPELRACYASDSRVTWIRNETLLPVQENWNKAVSLASDGWVKLLQADDRLLPGSINFLGNLFESNPDSSFIGHLSEIIDTRGLSIRRHAPYSHSHPIITLKAGDGPTLKLRYIARLREPTSNLFTKQAWKAVGGYSSSLRFTFDIDFNVRLMALFPGILCSSYLAQVRRHAQSDGAILPPCLAILDLQRVVRRMLESSNDRESRLYADSWIQYRIIELFAQRFRDDPLLSGRFLMQNLRYLLNLRSLGITCSTILRRILTGDVQRSLH